MKKLFIVFLICCTAIACKKEGTQLRKAHQKNIDEVLDTLRFNQLQIIGSHNSYRKRTDDDIFNFVGLLSGILPDNLNPKSWDYTHIPITDQLDLGLRSFELDIYYDPNGGQFYKRLGNALVGKDVNSRIPELLKPGMKMMHIPDFDYNTNYYTFKDALIHIRDWSKQHPKHLPIVLLVEQKESGVSSVLPFFTKIFPFSEKAYDEVDQEIIDVFGKDNPQIFKPDDLRKHFPNLKTAIQQEGWPKIADLRGKIMLVLYKSEQYIKNHPNLENRMMFQFSPTNSNNAAFVIIDDSKAVEEIHQAINAGAIVRTRSDGDTYEARTGDISYRESAFESGAQITSTDYYKPDYRAGQKGWTDFKVIFPTENYARASVYNAPDGQKGLKITE